MRDHETSETTREQQEIDPELDSPTEDLVYADEVDWDQEATLSSLINEDMVKEIASQLARANVDEARRDPATGGDEALSDQTAVAEETCFQWADEDNEDPEALGPTEDDQDRECEADGRHDGEDLDGIIEEILDERVSDAEPEAVAFTESPLASGQELRVLDRYGPPTASLGLVVLVITLAVAYAVGVVVQDQAVYFLSPAASTMVLTVLLGGFSYFLCRSWFKQAWERRNHVLDAAAATVLELEANPRSRSEETRRIFEETAQEMYLQARAEMEERAEKLREDTHRDVQKMRIFFESLLEKHVKRINDDLRAKTSEVEKLQMQQQDGEKADAELIRLTKENERLKTQFEDLEMELDQVDKDRRLKEDELEELRLKYQVETEELRADAVEREQADQESLSENERLKSELAELKADLEARGEECRRLNEEIEGLVRGADAASRENLDLFDKVSGQLLRNLQLASKLAAQLGEGGPEGVTDSESSLTTEISGHLENLERLISQVSDLSKLRSSAWKPTCTDVNVQDLLHESVDRVRKNADQSGIKLSVRTSKDLPRVSMDRRLVGRAVDELVANAVVYTNPGGRVTVRARLEEEEEADTDTLCLMVQDNGEGMNRAELKSIFEPFERGKHPRLSLSGAGAGLGLALAKGCADALGGDIAVDSKHGKGSTFTLKVPVDVVS